MFFISNPWDAVNAVSSAYAAQCHDKLYVQGCLESKTMFVISFRNKLTHWSRDKMAVIPQTIFSHALWWIEMYTFCLRFHWKLTIIDNNPALVQIVAWRQKGNKPLFEPTLLNLPTHICATGPQSVKLPRSMLKTRECVTTSQHLSSRDIQSICHEWYMGRLKKASHQRANSLIRIDVKHPGWLICYLHGTYCDYTALGRAWNIPDQWMLCDWTGLLAKP